MEYLTKQQLTRLPGFSRAIVFKGSPKALHYTLGIAICTLIMCFPITYMSKVFAPICAVFAGVSVYFYFTSRTVKAAFVDGDLIFYVASDRYMRISREMLDDFSLRNDRMIDQNRRMFNKPELPYDFGKATLTVEGLLYKFDCDRIEKLCALLTAFQAGRDVAECARGYIPSELTVYARKATFPGLLFVFIGSGFIVGIFDARGMLPWQIIYGVLGFSITTCYVVFYRRMVRAFERRNTLPPHDPDDRNGSLGL